MKDEQAYDIDEYLEYLKSFGVDITEATIIVDNWESNQEMR